jgi:DNA-binding NarL/FixJ family response regulator
MTALESVSGHDPAPVLVSVLGDEGERRDQLRRLLDGDPRLRIVAHGSATVMAVNALSAIRGADVVLLDIVGREERALELIARLVARPGAPPVVVLHADVPEDPALLLAAVMAGANGVACEHGPPGALGQALADVCAGLAVVPPSVQAALVLELQTRPPSAL